MDTSLIKAITESHKTEFGGQQLSQMVFEYRRGNRAPLINHIPECLPDIVQDGSHTLAALYLFRRDLAILTALSLALKGDWRRLIGTKLLGLSNVRLSDFIALEPPTYGALNEEHFSDAELEGIYFSECDLSWVGFLNSRMEGFHVENCHMREGCINKTQFYKGGITGSVFKDLWHIRDVYFRDVDFSETVFIGVPFERVTFHTCNMQSCTFINCSFKDTDRPPDSKYLDF